MNLHLRYPRSFHLFEWYAASAMVGIGAHLTAVPSSLAAAGGFHNIGRIVPAAALSMFCLFVGTTRLMAMVFREKTPVLSGYVRAGTGLLSALLWGQIAVSLLMGPNTGPGASVYVAMAACEALSVWRSRQEADGRCGS